jgi:cell division transport system permease protein
MIKTALRHIKRSPYQSMAAILMMSLTFFIIGVFSVTAIGMEFVLRYLETKPQITAFLKDDIKNQQIELLKGKLESTGKVKKIKYISKEEALSIYKSEFKDTPLLLEMVSAKILPASLEISAVNLAGLPGIAEVLKNDPIVEDLIFQKDVVSLLSSWVTSLRKAGLFLVAFLTAISVLMVLIVVGMKISSKRDEIEIMGLIGATSGYIRIPFIIEGMIYGITSGLVAWLATYILLLYSTPFLVSFLAGIPLFPIPWQFILTLLGGLLLLGMTIGGAGSFVATKHFLKLKR